MNLQSYLDARQPGDAVLSDHAAAILRAVRHDIDKVLKPEVTSPMAQMIAHMASEAITSLLTRDDRLPALREALVVRRCAALDALATLGQQTGSIDACQLADARAVLGQMPASGASEQQRRLLDASLASLSPPVMRAALASTDASVRGTMTAILRTVMETAASVQAGVQDALTSEPSSDATWRDQMRATVTAERVQAYWRQRFPDRPDVKVTSLRELPGGFGKTTILFELEGWEDKPSELVMRRDVLGGATEASVVDEFPILQVAYRHGVPLPEPLLLEADPARLDRPFIVVRRVEGEPAGTIWTVSPACTPQTGRDLAAAMARLHSIDLSAFGIEQAASSEAQMRAYFGAFRAANTRKRPEPDPAMELALTWIEENMPTPPERLSWVHSDPGFWNILVKDGRISSMLDWELGHVGDPAEDLAFVKSSVEAFMDWEDFLAAYREAGGPADYTARKGDFFAIWRDVRNSIFSDFADHAFWSGANPELRMVHCGMVSSKRLLQRALDEIAKQGLQLA